MTVLTAELRNEAVTLAQRDVQSRWAWGDWAIKVCGPVGERSVNDGSRERLTAAIAEVEDENAGVLLPDFHNLLSYRVAANTIPKKLRKTVPSVEAARMLGQRAKDRLELHHLIEALKNDKGVVTRNAVREHFDSQFNTPGQTEVMWTQARDMRSQLPTDPQERVELARKLMESPEVARKVITTPGKAGNIAAQEVSRRNAIERQAREAARAERDQREALPITAYEQRIIMRYINIAAELAPNAIPYEDLGPTARMRVAEALDRIVINAQASIEVCMPPEEDEPIESTSREGERRRLKAAG